MDNFEQSWKSRKAPPFEFALKFDGSCYVDIPGLNGYSSWSGGALACWVKLPPWRGPIGTQPLNNASPALGQFANFWLGFTPISNYPDSLQQIYSANPGANNPAWAIQEGGKWFHLAMTGDGGNSWITYLNGAPVYSGGAGNLNSANYDMILGGLHINTSPQQICPVMVELCDVRLYNSRLTPGEVASLYGQGQGLAVALGTTNELGWWQCNSLNVFDHSGNGYNGNCVGPVELVPTWGQPGYA